MAAKIAGEEWKNMTEQRGPYEEVARKNTEKYMQEMEAYKQTKDDMNLKKEEEEKMKLQKQEALQLLKKKEKTENIYLLLLTVFVICYANFGAFLVAKRLLYNVQKTKEQSQKQQHQNVDPNKPASSFLLFRNQEKLMQERPGINNSTLTAMISVKWKELNEEERQIWNSRAAEAMEAYKKELCVGGGGTANL
ncbi:hypothetical protein SADUNF_Sadunf03G0103800 [Salix dunnii]|uniref:HMG box domain-containing protein n=1 Tax=Salix dunnii TaxID=1413687 RepID=A0A835N0S5_9ROSI|nr:hypothetical protein SADUNF_Sadunf03G0103800 [Salix dunnii]